MAQRENLFDLLSQDEFLEPLFEARDAGEPVWLHGHFYDGGTYVHRVGDEDYDAGESEHFTTIGFDPKNRGFPNQKALHSDLSEDLSSERNIVQGIALMSKNGLDLLLYQVIPDTPESVVQDAIEGYRATSMQTAAEYLNSSGAYVATIIELTEDGLDEDAMKGLESIF